ELSELSASASDPAPIQLNAADLKLQRLELQVAAARECHHDGRPVATPQVSLGPKPAVPLEDLAAGLREMMGLEDNTSKLHAKK
ncbi:unnamed protein product, partial [Durusdinium trenchii]